ncbi:MAG TPA: S8 family serine peptidase [Symbiobacteriaceae bacterium]|jgi:subtilisin family serine protease
MRKYLAMFLVLLVAASLLGGSVSAAGKARRYTVVWGSNTVPANAKALVEAAGGTVVATMPEVGVMSVTGPAGLLNSLSAQSSVQAVSPTIEWTVGPASSHAADAIDTTSQSGPFLYSQFQWDIKQVTNNGASYQLDKGSHQTVVGIIDTGVSTQHPDLMANLLGGRNFTPDGPGGTVVPGDIEDKYGHGSHVAGAIAGNGAILGVGPDLGFRMYRIFGAEGGAPTDRIIAAMVAAADDGVDVISMSIGGYDILSKYTWTDPDTGTVYKMSDVADFQAFKRAVKYAVDHGAVVVAAAGNDATDIANPHAVTAMLNAEYGSLGYTFYGASREVPGTLPGVVTVAATGPDKSPAQYTNFGPGAIDVSAPGGDFKRYPNMTPTPWYWDLCFSAYKNGGYAWMAGTSMATPKVSAVAALIIDQAKHDGRRLNPTQVVARLQQTAIDVGKHGSDPYYGKGMVSAYAALGGK